MIDQKLKDLISEHKVVPIESPETARVASEERRPGCSEIPVVVYDEYTRPEFTGPAGMQRQASLLGQLLAGVMIDKPNPPSEVP